MVWWSGIGSSAGFSLIRQTHSKPRWWRGRGVEDAISFCLWAHRRVIIEENRSRLVVKDFRLLCRSDASLPSIGLPIGMESRSKLWLKVKLALRYIYDHHINDFDWFFKADDDTWVILLHGCSLILEKTPYSHSYTIVENLRHFLSPLNASLPLFLGRHFLSEDFSFSYYSGGAG